MEKFVATYNHYSQSLNLDLLKSKNREHFKDQIIETYIEVFKIFEKMDNTDNRVELYHLQNQVIPLEFKLQELWGFKKDKNYHRLWMEHDKCTCPKLDNLDDIGTGMRHINTECIIHGIKTFNIVNRENKLNRILKNNDNK